MPDNKYVRPIPARAIRNVGIDVYDIDTMFPMGNSALYHARKKMLMAGGRSGGKSELADLKEALWSLQEGIEILEDTEGHVEDSN